MKGISNKKWRVKVRSSPKALSRNCILVLGIHRSGTSALTRVINLLGAELPLNPLGSNPTNPSGHWEPERLVYLHERMLIEAGSRWDDWRAFDPGILGPERLARYKTEIADLIVEEYGSAPLMVVKDPRICRFVPLYTEILKGLGITPCYVLAYRNPLAVIASHGVRDGMTPSFSSLLWLRHVLDAEAATRSGPRCFLSYENLMDDWRDLVRRMAAALRLEWRSIDEAIAEIDEYLSRDLQHYAFHSSELEHDLRIVGWIRETYSALLMLEQTPEDASAIAVLDRVRADFELAASIFGDAIFPELAARAGKWARALAVATAQIAAKDQEILRLHSVINDIYESTSWKITQPLRAAGRVFSRPGTARGNSAEAHASGGQNSQDDARLRLAAIVQPGNTPDG